MAEYPIKQLGDIEFTPEVLFPDNQRSNTGTVTRQFTFNDGHSERKIVSTIPTSVTLSGWFVASENPLALQTLIRDIKPLVGSEVICTFLNDETSIYDLLSVEVTYPKADSLVEIECHWVIQLNYKGEEETSPEDS